MRRPARSSPRSTGQSGRAPPKSRPEAGPSWRIEGGPMRPRAWAAATALPWEPMGAAPTGAKAVVAGSPGAAVTPVGAATAAAGVPVAPPAPGGELSPMAVGVAAWATLEVRLCTGGASELTALVTGEATVDTSGTSCGVGDGDGEDRQMTSRQSPAWTAGTTRAPAAKARPAAPASLTARTSGGSEPPQPFGPSLAGLIRS